MNLIPWTWRKSDQLLALLLSVDHIQLTATNNICKRMEKGGPGTRAEKEKTEELEVTWGSGAMTTLRQEKKSIEKGRTMKHSNKEQGMLTHLLYRFKILSIVLVKLKSYPGMKNQQKPLILCNILHSTINPYLCSFLPWQFNLKKKI